MPKIYLPQYDVTINAPDDKPLDQIQAEIEAKKPEIEAYASQRMGVSPEQFQQAQGAAFGQQKIPLAEGPDYNLPARIARTPIVGPLVTEPAKALERGFRQTASTIGGAGVEAAGGAFATMTQGLRDIGLEQPLGAPISNPLEGQIQIARQTFQPDLPRLQPSQRMQDTTYTGALTEMATGEGPSGGRGQAAVDFGTKLVSDTLGIAPSMAATVAAFFMAGPAGAGAMGGFLEGASQYEAAKAAGKSEQKALQELATVGVGTGVLNAIPFIKAFDKVLPDQLKGYAANFLLRGAVEGATETAEGALPPLAELERVPRTTKEATDLLVNMGAGIYDESGVFLPAMISGGLMGGGATAPRRAAAEQAPSNIGQYFARRGTQTLTQPVSGVDVFGPQLQTLRRPQGPTAQPEIKETQVPSVAPEPQIVDLSEAQVRQTPKKLQRFETLFDEAAAQTGIQPDILMAIAQVESGGNPKAVSPKGAKGIMQIMDATARELGVQDATDPNQAIPAAARYLARGLERHNGDLDLALADYNAGPGNVDKYGGVPPFKETQEYIRKVRSAMAAIQGDTVTASLLRTPPDKLQQVVDTRVNKGKPVTAKEVKEIIGEGDKESVKPVRDWVNQQVAAMPPVEEVAPLPDLEAVPNQPIKAVHFSRTPNLSLSSDSDLSKIPYSYGDESVFGQGFYAAEPKDEGYWRDVASLGENRNEVTITPKNPIVITPSTVKSKGFDAIDAAVSSGNHDAVIMRGWEDYDKKEGGVSDLIRKRLRQLWTPIFWEGKKEGKFLNVDEFEKANEQAVKEVTGISYQDYKRLTSRNWDQNQIFVPKSSVKDVVSVTPQPKGGESYGMRQEAQGRQGEVTPAQQAGGVQVPPPAKQPWEMTKSEFDKQGFYLHKDIRAKTQEERDANRDSILQKGLERRGPSAINTLPAYRGGKPTDIVDKKYAPKAGERGYLIPKKFVDSKGNFVSGFNPGPSGVVDFTKDYQSVHEAIIESALASGQPVPASVLAEYPDLAAKYQQQPNARTQTLQTAAQNLAAIEGKAEPVVSEDAGPGLVDWLNRAGKSKQPQEMTYEEIQQQRDETGSSVIQDRYLFHTSDTEGIQTLKPGSDGLVWLSGNVHQGGKGDSVIYAVDKTKLDPSRIKEGKNGFPVYEGEVPSEAITPLGNKENQGVPLTESELHRMFRSASQPNAPAAQSDARTQTLQTAAQNLAAIEGKAEPVVSEGQSRAFERLVGMSDVGRQGRTKDLETGKQRKLKKSERVVDDRSSDAIQREQTARSEFREALAAEAGTMSPKEIARREAVARWGAKHRTSFQESVAVGDLIRSDYQKAASTELPTSRLLEIIQSGVDEGAITQQQAKDAAASVQRFRDASPGIPSEPRPTAAINTLKFGAQFQNQPNGPVHTFGAIIDKGKSVRYLDARGSEVVAPSTRLVYPVESTSQQETPNAIEARQQQQNRQPERIQIGQGGPTAEAGGGNRAVQGGQEQRQVEPLTFRRVKVGKKNAYDTTVSGRTVTIDRTAAEPGLPFEVRVEGQSAPVDFFRTLGEAKDYISNTLRQEMEAEAQVDVEPVEAAPTQPVVKQDLTAEGKRKEPWEMTLSESTPPELKRGMELRDAFQYVGTRPLSGPTPYQLPKGGGQTFVETFDSRLGIDAPTMAVVSIPTKAVGRPRAARSQAIKSLEHRFGAGIDEKANVVRDQHRADVEQALASGKAVPLAVLADYPDLAAKYAQPTTEESSVTAPQPSGGTGQLPTPRPIWKQPFKQYAKERMASEGLTNPADIAEREQELRRVHRRAVQDAIAAGEKVPVANVKEYGVSAEVAAAPAKAEGQPKQAWEMTREEFFNNPDAVRKELGGINPKSGTGFKVNYKYSNPSPAGPFTGSTIVDVKPAVGDDIRAIFGTATITSVKQDKVKSANISINERYDEAKAAHRNAIESALSSGKPVPASVLADYPDLQARFSTPANPAPDARKGRFESPEIRTKDDLRSEYEALKAVLDAELEATTKELQGRVKKRMTKREKTPLDEAYREAVRKRDKSLQDLSYEFSEAIRKTKEHEADKAKEKEMIQEYRAKLDSDEQKRKQENIAETHKKVLNLGGYDAVLVGIESNIRKAEGNLKRASDANKWKYESEINTLTRQLDFVKRVRESMESGVPKSTPTSSTILSDLRSKAQEEGLNPIEQKRRTDKTRQAFDEQYPGSGGKAFSDFMRTGNPPKKPKRGADPTNPQAGVINLDAPKAAWDAFSDFMFRQTVGPFTKSRPMGVAEAEAFRIARRAQEGVANRGNLQKENALITFKRALRQRVGGEKFTRSEKQLVSRASDLSRKDKRIRTALAPKNASKADVMQSVRDVLDGKSKVLLLPEKVYNASEGMRDILAAGGEFVVENGIASGEGLVAKIVDNVGFWLRRSYRVHKDPNWVKTVQGRPEWDAAIDAMEKEWREFVDTPENQTDLELIQFGRRHLPGVKNAKALNEIEAALKDDPNNETLGPEVRAKVEEALRALGKPNRDQLEIRLTEMLQEMSNEGRENFANRRLGSQNRSSFMRRNEIPKWLRDVMGEYHDTEINFALSSEAMTQMISAWTFSQKMYELGYNKFIFNTREEIPASLKGSYYTKVPDNPKYGMLAGKYTSQELKDAIDQKIAEAGTIGKLFNTLSGTIRWLLTIGNVATGGGIRNFVTSGIGAMLRGDIPIATGAKFFRVLNKERAIMPALAKSLNMEYTSELGMLKALAQHHLEMVERGVHDSDPNFNLAKDRLKDSFLNDLLTGKLGEESYLDVPREKVLALKRKMENLWLFGDNFWKSVSHAETMNRWSPYAKKQRWSEQRLRDYIDGAIRGVTPTYAETYEIINRMKRTGTGAVYQDFITWQAERFRNKVNLVRLIRDELATGDKTLMASAAMRIATLAVHHLGFTALLPIIGKWGLGSDSDDEDWAVRQFVPAWMNNSAIGYLGGRNKDGNYRIADLSYSDPDAWMNKMIFSAFQGDWDEVPKTFAETFFGMAIAAELIAELMTNTKGNQQPIWLSTDSVRDWLAKVGRHVIFRAGGTPAKFAVHAYEKAHGKQQEIGARSLHDQAMSMGGSSIWTVNPKENTRHYALKTAAQFRAISKQITDSMTKYPNQDEKALREKYGNQRNKSAEELVRIGVAGRETGLTQNQIRQIFKDASIRQDYIAKIMMAIERSYNDMKKTGVRDFSVQLPTGDKAKGGGGLFETLKPMEIMKPLTIPGL